MIKTNFKPLVLANWKMNLNIKESVSVAKSVIKALVKDIAKVDLVLCPTYPALPAVGEVLKKSQVSLGAQDVFWKDIGPYTGEISPWVLKEVGVSHVIVGHSERRNYLKESDQMVHYKALNCLAENLVPVVCVGETLAERQQGNKDLVVFNQVKSALSGMELSDDQHMVVAYEPVWVIGSGQAIDDEEAEHMAQVIKEALLDIFSSDLVNQQIRIIYGGSVDASNVRSFIKGQSLSGVLVGGAALQSIQLAALVKALVK